MAFYNEREVVNLFEMSFGSYLKILLKFDWGWFWNTFETFFWCVFGASNSFASWRK